MTIQYSNYDLNEMTIERNLLISILKLTKSGPIRKELISRDARIPTQIADETLRKLSEAGFIQWRGNVVGASLNQRVKMAVHAVQLGTDLERVCKVLDWAEFEDIAAEAFKANDFKVKQRFHFKWGGRKWEIDILGCREPLIACVDCKHWHHGWQRSAIVKAVDAQVERTQVLADALPSLHEEVGLANWKSATLIPIVLSLIPSPFKLHNNVPIVPVLQLQNFITELPAQTFLLTHFSIKIRSEKYKLTKYLK